MEIHAPDHPITGWKDTVKHLAIITAGVLIPGGGNPEQQEGARAQLFGNIERERKELEQVDRVAQTLVVMDYAEVRQLAGLGFQEVMGRALLKRYDELLK
jgi:hypothetical protein